MTPRPQMASLPHFLFDSHKRYKEDTNRVASWLAETGQKCGYSLNSDAPESAPTTGRLKGKARKEAREKERAQAAETTTSAVRRTLTANDFIGLAQRIANHKPIVKVPRLILGLLRSAINLRNHCSVWFQENATTEEDRIDNSNHSHFIGVLERVEKILEPNSVSESTYSVQNKTTAQNVDTTARSETELDKSINIYDILYIDDDNSTTLPDTIAAPQNAAPNTKSRPPPRKIIYEMEATEEDAYFALACFFFDLKQLRHFLFDLWRDYDSKKLSLMAASVTTNSAINLVRRAEHDLITSFPTLESFDEISKTLNAVIHNYQNQNSSKSQSSEDQLDASLAMADFLYMSTYSAIQAFCSIVKEKGLQLVVRTDDYNARRDQRTATIRDRKEEEAIILLEAISEFFFLTKHTCHPPLLDELSDGLGLAFAEKSVPLWLAFAAQIFVDIHFALRKDVARGLSELQAYGTQLASSLKQYHSDTPIAFANWPQFNTAGIRHVDQTIGFWILGDALDDVKRQILGKSYPSQPTESFALLKSHPLFCGLFQFKLLAYMRHITVDLAENWGTILYVAYLYEACQRAGYLKQIWQDMELVMDIHSRERMFAGRIPQTPKEFLTCMQLTLGVSLVNFSRSNRLNHVQRSNKKRRGLTFESPLTNLFPMQWNATGDVMLTINNVEDLLMKPQFASTLRNDPLPGDDENLAPKHSPLQKQWLKSRKMTPLQLVDTLRNAISAEEYMLRFDYISFHTRCLRLLRTLRTALDSQLKDRFGPHYIDDERQLCYLIYYILKEVTKSEGSERTANQKTGFESSMLKDASEVVETYIKQEGSMECDNLEKTCLSWSRYEYLRPQSNEAT